MPFIILYKFVPPYDVLSVQWPNMKAMEQLFPPVLFIVLSDEAVQTFDGLPV